MESKPATTYAQRQPEPPRLSTVEQFCQRNPAFPAGSIRWHIFRAGGDDPLGLGAAGAFVRVGRRVYVNEDRFFAAIDAAQPGAGSRR